MVNGIMFQFLYYFIQSVVMPRYSFSRSNAGRHLKYFGLIK